MPFDMSVASGIGLASRASAPSRMGRADLTSADFLRLMTEQLKNQDPLKPLSNAEFVSQMAEMSTAQGVGELEHAMATMTAAVNSDQALRGAALIGRSALIETDRLALGADAAGGLAAAGVAAAPAAGLISIDIFAANGSLVRRLQVQAEGAGDVAFQWDGRNEQGQAMAPGVYLMRASFGTGREAQAVGTGTMALIESVTLDPQGMLLNLRDLGAAPLSTIRRIG